MIYYKLVMKRYLILFILSLISIAAIQAQDVTFTISAPNSTVEGGQIQVKYILRVIGNAGNPSSPELNEDIKGFEVVYGPAYSQSMSTTIINGKASSESNWVFTYTMMATAQGTFTIPAASINVGGRNYKSNTAQIRVLPPDKDAKNNQQGGRPIQETTSSSTAANINPKDAFVRAIFSKTKVAEQEALVVTFRFYTVLNVREAGKVEFPEFEGFMVEDFDLPANRQWRLENFNGKNYQVIDVKKSLLFPQRSGKITIPSGKLDIVFAVKSGQVSDMFFGTYDVMSEVKRTLKTTPVTVDIESLPTGKPLNFSGAVGTFTFTPVISDTHVKANEAVTIKLDISGTGNLKLIKNPVIQFPKDMETYDPKVNNDFRITENGLSGTRSIEYMFIPRYPGEYTIPPVEFNYFDIKEKKYKKLTSPSYTLKVDKDPNAGKNTSATSYMNQREVQIEQDIRYIKTDDYEFHRSSDFFIGSLGNILWYLIPLILFVICSIMYRKQIKANADVVRMRTKKANKVASKRLKLAKRYLDASNKDSFYEEVLRAVWGYLSDKLTIPVAELSRENIEMELRKYGVGEELLHKYISILDTCEFARYSPASGSSEAMDKTYSETVDAIDKMENVIKKQL